MSHRAKSKIRLPMRIDSHQLLVPAKDKAPTNPPNPLSIARVRGGAAGVEMVQKMALKRSWGWELWMADSKGHVKNDRGLRPLDLTCC